MIKQRRQGKLKIQLLVEGYSERYYFDKLKKLNNLVLTYKVVNLKGGGYKSFLAEMKKEADLGYVAKVIIIDYDIATERPEEKMAFQNIVNYCKQKNTSGRIPYILIVDNPKFEYFACLHSPKFKKQNMDKFILDTFGYKTITEFKSDENIYDKLNAKENSLEQAHSALEVFAGDKIIKNNYTYSNKGIDISIKNNKITYNSNADICPNSNMEDFLELILPQSKISK